MKVYPEAKMTVLSVNVPSFLSSDLDEWSAGTYSKNATVKIASTGKVYHSIIDGNISDPSISRDWEFVGWLEYQGSVTYKANDAVWLVENNSIYLSLEDDNNTHPLDIGAKWKFLSLTNAYSFRDYYNSTITRQIDQSIVIEVSFEYGCNEVNLFGLYGSSVIFEQIDTSTGQIINRAVDNLVDTSLIVSFASWLRFRTDGAKREASFNLIPRRHQRLRVTIEPRSKEGVNVAELATLIVGREVDLGCTINGTSEKRLVLNPLSYDEWGNVERKEGDYIKLYDVSTSIKTVEYDAYSGKLDELQDIPAVYKITDGRHRKLNVLAMYEDQSLVMQNHARSRVSMRLRSSKFKKESRIY